MAEKKLLHNNYNFGLVGKKKTTKNHGNTQVSTLNWVKVHTAKRKKQICNSKVFQYVCILLCFEFQAQTWLEGI